MYKVIAIDFDGCLCSNNWPGVGEPHWNVINRAKAEQQNGAKLILWTCRYGADVDVAVKACESWGLHFDAVNDNLDSLKEKWGNNTRKVGADEYWDDRAVRMDQSYTYDGTEQKSTRTKMTRQKLTRMQGGGKGNT